MLVTNDFHCMDKKRMDVNGNQTYKDSPPKNKNPIIFY